MTEMSPALAEFDRRARALLASPQDPSAPMALWQGAMLLEAWTLLGNGDAAHPEPFTLDGPQGLLLCIYSTPERAAQAGAHLGLSDSADPSSSAQLIEMPMPAALDWVISCGAVGVHGVTLDHPWLGLAASLDDLSLWRASLPLWKRAAS